MPGQAGNAAVIPAWTLPAGGGSLPGMADFRTPYPALVAAVARIHAGLRFPGGWGGPWFMQSRLLTAWRESHDTGDTRIEIARLTELLAPHAWEWPWLARCAAEFERADTWPKYWPEVGVPRPFAWGAMAPKARIDLLHATLSVASYAERDNLQRADMTLPRGWRWELRAMEEDCPAERAMVERFGPAIASRRFADLPPYFPGDSCRIRMRSPRDKARRR